MVLPMRDAIKKVNMDYVKKLWDSDGRFNYRIENAEKLNRGEVVPMVFTSLCRFPIYEADFGWGKPVWVGSTKMLYHNIVTVEVSRVWLELPSPIILLNQIQAVLGNPIQLGL